MLGTTGDVAEFDDPTLGNEGVSSGDELVWAKRFCPNGRTSKGARVWHE